MKHHYLKILPEYFEDVKSGIKTFEYRRNDRNYEAGDTATLFEFDNVKDISTGRMLDIVISYVLENKLGLPLGFAILAIHVISI